MLPYWLMFTLWAAGAVQAERRHRQDPRVIYFIAAALFTTLMIGLRFEVGGDWAAYLGMYDTVFFLSFADAIQTTDPGYAALNWLAVQLGVGISFVNLICAALFMGGVARLAWRRSNPALAILVAAPYLIIVVAMGYTRQAAAIGVICFAIADASEQRVIRMVALIGVAALMHKTAILILPIALVPIFRRSAILGILGFALFAGLFVLILKNTSDKLVLNYVQGSYDSQGATIRVAMNVVAAGIFWWIRKRLTMDSFQRSFWTVCAIFALLSVVGLAASSSSSGVDRLSLYLIPLQILTYSELPYAYGKNKMANVSMLFAVIAYCFIVQFTWLNFANNAYYWVPYHFSL